VGSGIKVAFALLAVASIFAAAGCGSEPPVDSAQLAKEIEAPKNTNTGFSDKMEKYKIGGENSPPGMKGGGPQAVPKGGR